MIVQISDKRACLLVARTPDEISHPNPADLSHTLIQTATQLETTGDSNESLDDAEAVNASSPNEVRMHFQPHHCQLERNVFVDRELPSSARPRTWNESGYAGVFSVFEFPVK
jgi:hypothetical protein